jgi:hypothetical protein
MEGAGSGVSLILPVAVSLGSATLVAVTVNFWATEIPSGAVYTPVFDMLPTTGLRRHVTALFVLLVNFALNV